MTTEELANLKELMAKIEAPWKQDGRSPHYIMDKYGFIVVRCDVSDTLAGIVALVSAAPALIASAARAAELEQALRHIVECDRQPEHDRADHYRRVARAALEQKQ